MADIAEVDETVEEVSCDGGKTFGHPRIYMALGDDGAAECYYCGRRFQRRTAKAEATKSDAA